MERQRIYCEIDFYKQFVNSFSSNTLPNQNSIEKIGNWIELNSFLYKSDLFLNIQGNDFKTLTEEDDYFKMLWKRHVGGECAIEFLNSEFPKLGKFEEGIYANKEYLDSVFLSCESIELCKAIEDSYGVKVISIENMLASGNLPKEHEQPIEKGDKQITSWDFISTFKHPCNSLAIIDNFILKNTDTIEKNLFVILDNILPSHLKIPFHISVFAKNERNLNYKDYHGLIYKSLTKLKPNLTFKLTIHQLRGEIHDRTLITNYLILDSGSGFDLFNGKRPAYHQTKIIGYYPWSKVMLNSDSSKDYNILRKSLKKIYTDACSTPYLINYWGDKENRLFD